MKTQETADYYAFLIRFWREDQFSEWRVLVEDPHTGQSTALASMRALFDFLDEQTSDREG